MAKWYEQHEFGEPSKVEEFDTSDPTSASIDSSTSESIDIGTSETIDTDFCHRSIPLKIPERSSCPQDIADLTHKSTDISSYSPSPDVEKEITIEDFLEEPKLTSNTKPDTNACLGAWYTWDWILQTSLEGKAFGPRSFHVSSRGCYDVLILREISESVAGPPAHKINHTSYIGASSDIGASKEGYLCDHEDFGHKNTSYRFSTQPEHAAKFHTKRSSGLGDTPFTSQTTYTASELVLFKESNSLLNECATQTHEWKPGDHSLHLRPVGELIPCIKPHWISQILYHLNLPFLEQIYNKSQQLFLSMIASTLAICSINHKIPKAPRIFPKLYLDHQALCGFTSLSDWRLRLLVESGCSSSWLIVESVNTLFCPRSSSSLPSSRFYSRLDRLEEPPLLLDQSSL
ncbi:hypothetical protein YC2023_016949 [Brassica napus]